MNLPTHDYDVNVDDQIFACLNVDAPKSFFLFAGAGSGKTRSLVKALQHIRRRYGQILRVKRQRIAIITYTNAACDEIKKRIDYDPLFFVSTIHSFVWELIKSHQHDIREWLRVDLNRSISKLQEQQATGRPSSQAYKDRVTDIESKTKRLANLDSVRQFTYNPNGENRTKDSLNHTEVVRIAADFLQSKIAMQQILTRRYPILFIDESQDTKKELVDALFTVQAANSGHFSMGFFGDTMQRIFPDGKENLGQALPPDWVKPAKKINHRCPKRVVTLLNKIRSQVPGDNHQQEPRNDKIEGHIRLFVVNRHNTDKFAIEAQIATVMADLTGDVLWNGDKADVKTLILEHHMAAKRMGFEDLFTPLHEVESLKTSLLDGTLPGLRFFTKIVLPLLVAHQKEDAFEIARIVKQESLLLSSKALQASSDQLALVDRANEATKSLLSLWDDEADPTLLEVLQNINKSSLFPIPEHLSIIAARQNTSEPVDTEEETDLIDPRIAAWDKALVSSFSQVSKYNVYLSEDSKFGTHQGVKGLEFERVMLIIDDEEARGFLFSYDKLFGVKEFTATDHKNIKEGKETSFDRTLRLFYVACSRAEKSLAIVAYTDNPEKVLDAATQKGWFQNNEVIIL